MAGRNHNHSPRLLSGIAMQARSTQPISPRHLPTSVAMVTSVESLLPPSRLCCAIVINALMSSITGLQLWRSVEILRKCDQKVSRIKLQVRQSLQ